jgi:hypothetical protein
MQGTRKPDRAGEVRKPIDTSGPKRDSEGLTCNEGQVEDLLSEGESTEDEVGEDFNSDKAAPQQDSSSQ